MLGYCVVAGIIKEQFSVSLKKTPRASLKLFILISSYILSPGWKEHQAPAIRAPHLPQAPCRPALPSPRSSYHWHELNGLKSWGFSAKNPPRAALSTYCTRIYRGAENPATTIACALHLTLSKGFPGIGLLLFFLSPHPRISGMLSLSI